MFGKSHSFLGIDLGAGGVKLVELKVEKNRPVLLTYAVTSDRQDVHHLLPNLPGSKSKSFLTSNHLPAATELSPGAVEAETEEKAAKYAAILKTVVKRANAKSKRAVVSLPVSAVFHAIVTLPIVKKEEFDYLLKAEVGKLLPYPLDEATLDYQVLPGSKGATSERVLVNAVPRSLVVFYTKVFAAAGLQLEALEPESVALTRSLIGRDQSVTMLVDIGAEQTNFFIIDGAIPITHHSIEVGGSRLTENLKKIWQVNDDIAETMKQDLFNEVLLKDGRLPITKEHFKNLIMPIADPIIKEIQYGLEVYLKQTGNEGKMLEKVVLTGGAAILPYLNEQIAEIFKLKCYIGDPWGRVVYQERLRPLLRSIGPRMSVAIGLALRGMV